MKLRQVIFKLTAVLLLSSCSTNKTGISQKEQYPNLFKEAGYNDLEIRKKIQSVYTQLFFGDKNSEAIYYEAGKNDNGPLAYIHDVHSNDVRSEGMSYGMMIAVQMDKKEIFNSLWNWSKTYMYHKNPQHPAYGYFGWSLTTKGIFNDEMPAPDGEEYYAAALYFAQARWGNGEGIYDYKKEADKLVSDMIHRKPITRLIKDRNVTGVNLFDQKNHMVRFTPDAPNSDHTDASYHVPAFYEIFALKGPKKDQYFWKNAATASRDYFEKSANLVTGLTPDYGNFDGTPWASPWRPASATFSYDAWRTAMNWSVDWSWWKKDSGAIARSNRILNFFIKEGIDKYGHQYTLAGEKLENGQPAGLIACNAVAALTADSSNKLEFVRALWELKTPTGPYRYYDSMLMMMAILHCSGEFKMYI